MVLWGKWFLKWHDLVWRSDWYRKNEDFSQPETLAQPSEIAVNSYVKNCYECGNKFSFFNRRNQCYQCNNVFCDKCITGKEDIHGATRIFCKTCFVAYSEHIDAEMKGISESLLLASGMTKRVLGTASRMTQSNREESAEEFNRRAAILSTAREEVEIITKSNCDEIDLDARDDNDDVPDGWRGGRALSRKDWLNLDPSKRELFVEQKISKEELNCLPPSERDTFAEDEGSGMFAQYVHRQDYKQLEKFDLLAQRTEKPNVFVSGNTANSSADKKPIFSNITTIFKSSAPLKRQSSEDVWASRSGVVTSTEAEQPTPVVTPSLQSSSRNSPKRSQSYETKPNLPNNPPPRKLALPPPSSSTPPPLTVSSTTSSSTTPPRSESPPKRFIPFSNAMMTKSTTDLFEEQKKRDAQDKEPTKTSRRSSEEDPPPLARKYITPRTEAPRTEAPPSQQKSTPSTIPEPEPVPNKLPSKSQLLLGKSQAMPPPSTQQLSIVPKTVEPAARKNSGTSRLDAYKNNNVVLKPQGRRFSDEHAL